MIPLDVGRNSALLAYTNASRALIWMQIWSLAFLLPKKDMPHPLNHSIGNVTCIRPPSNLSNVTGPHPNPSVANVSYSTCHPVGQCTGLGTVLSCPLRALPSTVHSIAPPAPRPQHR